MRRRLLAALGAACMAMNGVPVEAALWTRRRVLQPCELLMLEHRKEIPPAEALNILVDAVRPLETQPVWSQVITSYLLPSLGTPSPNLVLTLVGPSNSGKSLIFNSLPFLKNPEHDPHSLRLQDPSTVSFDAQSTARPVLMFSDGLFDEKGTFDARFALTERWRSREQTLEAGPPLVYLSKDFYKNLIFVDTPAFNWPVSREAVSGVMRATDVLVYVFSNANYDDEENLAFLREWLLVNGPRDIILVYNVDSAIPADVIHRHFTWVGQKISGLTGPDDIPITIIGTYQMVHSDKVARGEQVEEFVPQGHDPPLEKLFAAMDEHALTQRRQSLHLALAHVLRSAEQTMAQLEREDAELKLAEQIFDKYLKQLVRESLERFPFYRLGTELELTWNRQASGIRGLAHWVAHPLRMAGLHRDSGPVQISAVREIERQMELAVDQVTAKFRLGVAERVVRMPADDPLAKEADELVRKFNQRFPTISGDEKPAVVDKDGHLQIRLPASAAMTRYFDKYLTRDWDAVVASTTKDAKENFSDLTMRIQTQLKEIARQQGLPTRSMQALYVTLAVLPILTAVAYMAYQGTGLTDVQTLATIFGSHLAARLFVSLDQQSLQRGWNQSVQEWFTSRQQPRLIEIFDRHVGMTPTDAKASIDREAMRSAIQSLKASGLEN